MITEPEVNFRKRRLRADGESLLGDDLGWLDRRLSNGGDSDRCNSNRNHRSDDQRAAISHGRLHPLALQQAMGAASLGM